MAEPFWKADEIVSPRPEKAKNNYFWTKDEIVVPKGASRDSLLGKVDAAVRGVADTLTFGLADEIAAAGDAALQPILGTGEAGPSFSERYSANKRQQNAIDKSDADKRTGYRLAGQVVGGVAGGVGLAKAGLSATANAVNAGKSLPAVMLAGAKEGAILGGLHGAGSGEGVDGRVSGASTGALIGGVGGAAAPAVVAGVSAVGKPLVAPLMARLRPEEYANSAIGEAMKRSGMSADEIAASLAAAQRDGQTSFTIADAMGNSGQRMLSTVARNPNDMRQPVVEGLISRQMDQGRRVAGALNDASGSVMSAQRLTDLAKASRSVDAGINYGPVSREIAPINVTPAVSAANRAISPFADNVATAAGAVPTDLAARAGIEAGEAAIRDPIRNALKEARSYLASDKLTVTNVEKAFRAKTNIDMMISKAIDNKQGALAEALQPIQKQLDDALARTSKQYAAARDAYNAASGVIDAVDIGRTMASPRNRTEDTLRAFRHLPADQQHAARVGYFDPLIARAESAAGSSTDSARPFLSESMRQELPALAAPGQADSLVRRLGRETTMSETARAALGGSKTADNLADAAEMAKFDPGVMQSLMRGRPVEAVFAALSKVRNEAGGLPPRVIEQVGRVMIETNPAEALRVLRLGMSKSNSDQNIKALSNSILQGLSATGAGRLGAP